MGALFVAGHILLARVVLDEPLTAAKGVGLALTISGVAVLSYVGD